MTSTKYNFLGPFDARNIRFLDPEDPPPHYKDRTDSQKSGCPLCEVERAAKTNKRCKPPA